MVKISTLYSNYQELLLDLDIFGSIIKEPPIDEKEYKKLLFEEYKKTHHRVSLEDKRYELSDIVSSDYHVSYTNEIELKENEEILELEKSDNIEIPNIEDEFIEVPQEIKEYFSPDKKITDTKRLKLISELDYFKMDDSIEEFTGNVESVEKVFNTVKTNTDNILSEQMNSLVSSVSNSSESDVNDEEEDYVQDDEEILDTEDSEDYESDDDEDEYDDGEEYESDEDESDDEDEYDDGEEYESDEDEDYEYEYESDEDDEEDYEYEDDESDDDEDSDDDYEYDSNDESEDEESDDYDDENEYESDDEESDEDDYEYVSDNEESSDDLDEKEDLEYSDGNFVDSTTKPSSKVASSSINKSGVSSDSVFEAEDYDGIEFIPNRKVEVHTPKVPIPPKQAEPSKPVDRSAEPRTLREFLRKYPHSEVSFVLQYFSKKEIQKEIMMGNVIKKGNKLHI